MEASEVGRPVESPESSSESARRTARRVRDASPSLQQNAPTFGGRPPLGQRQLTLNSHSPMVRMEVLGPKAISVGKETIYRIHLMNQGSVAARYAIVAVTLPDSVEVIGAKARLGSVGREKATSGTYRVKWQIDQLEPQSQQDLAITVKPLNNQPVELKVDWTFRAESLAATIEVQQPKLEIAVDGPTEMSFGETRVFKIRLANIGNGPAEDVMVQLDATGAAANPNRIGNLAAGETRDLEIELTAGQPGKMKILAVATAVGNLTARVSHEVRVRRAKLVANVSAPQFLFAGTSASYEIHVANEGDAVAKDLILEVALPRGAKEGQGIDNQPITATTPRWRIGSLAPGSERTYAFRCVLTAEGKNSVSVRLQSADNLTAATAATTQVEAVADLKLMVNDPPGPIPVGREVTYEVKLVNRGSKEARNIKLVAQFSDGVEPTRAIGQPSEIVPGQVIFDPILAIPAGGELVLKITARANTGGNARFRAELTCSEPDTKLVSEETTRFFAAAPGTLPKSEPIGKLPGGTPPIRR